MLYGYNGCPAGGTEGGGQAGRGAARSDGHANKPPTSASRTISHLGRGQGWAHTFDVRATV